MKENEYRVFRNMVGEDILYLLDDKNLSIIQVLNGAFKQTFHCLYYNEYQWELLTDDKITKEQKKLVYFFIEGYLSKKS